MQEEKKTSLPQPKKKFFLNTITKMPMDSSKWIDVTTEKNHYSLDHFVIPTHYEHDVSSILIPHGVIMDRVNKLARLIVDEATGPLVVCCILKGGHQYFADLVNAMKKLTMKNGQTLPLSLEFVRVKSYRNDKSEGVTMSITEDECKEFEGKVNIYKWWGKGVFLKQTPFRTF
jgi:hypoxanthine phosphoribosyltransferase